MEYLEREEREKVVMNLEARDKWVAALRSGEYRQGTGNLCRREGDELCMCALGVLIDCTQQPEWRAHGTFLLPYKNGLNQETRLIYESLGLDTLQVRYSITMNDKHKMSFGEIADYVEENL